MKSSKVLVNPIAMFWWGILWSDWHGHWPCWYQSLLSVRVGILWCWDVVIWLVTIQILFHKYQTRYKVCIFTAWHFFVPRLTHQMWVNIWSGKSWGRNESHKTVHVNSCLGWKGVVNHFLMLSGTASRECSTLSHIPNQTSWIYFFQKELWARLMIFNILTWSE